jgi:hypothetical protein
VSQANERHLGTAPRRTLTVLACVVGAIAALGLVSLASMDLYLTGFPDSHLTDYDKAAAAPKRLLIWAEWGFVVLFPVLAVLPIGSRGRAIGWLVALVALLLVALVQWFGIPWYFATHLGLDNGVGG